MSDSDSHTASASRSPQPTAWYAFPGIGLDASVFECDGKLMLQARGQAAVRILLQGGLEFRADFDTDVRLVFAADGESLVIYQNGGKAEGACK